MKPVAIIPARGGSKRIPDKNIRAFAGKPIIQHAIETAQRSGLFRRIVVSTDSERVADVAEAAGAEVPFMRSAQSSNDHATLAEAVIETLEGLERRGDITTHLCCLLATTPMVTANMLADAWQQLNDADLDAVASVQQFHYPIQRALRCNADGHLEMMWPEYRTARSQDLEAAWHDAGQFYWVSRDALLRHRRLIAGRAGGFELTALDAVDIDTPEDWILAEQLYAFRLHDTNTSPDP